MLENYVELLAILATIFGSLMGFANFPQAYKLYKNKSSENISFLTYLIFLIGAVIWFLYGIAINEIPIILSNAIGLIAVSTVLILYFKYKK